MAMEIREVAIHLAIGPSVAPGGAPTPEPAAGAGGLTPAQHEAIVSACVAQVLQHLRQIEAR
ncbi:DUF5908 family protein [Caulobacter sp. NIBR1757]|uniref:DUF5908 family protein n=1 Tax=Caulobacter sp. NIBR1757 TaxID=3016000 RepID=UPI0022EFEA81|nr:DUF5908 family protein [Caulobacter sp. NIBR1757]WGM39910.1 hypothetical protein AMEJIAPC_02850 [Caulobacter sp. NIBR1757]